eukprot:3434586-Lingulodinium_polyedra.AAC.1
MPAAASSRGGLPARAAPRDASLWRCVGALGRAYRLHRDDVPSPLVNKLIETLLEARRLLLPHV